MSEAAWNKAFTQGSRDLQNRLKKVHAKNPKFQTWLKSSGHGTDTSVKQASKEVKPSARVKSLQTKSLQAYGATKGVKVGGEHGSEDMRDTIAPLTRDQHSKVQAAERAAKAAAKKAAPAKPKKPLSTAERMAAIARAVTKAKAKDRFDVPTVNPDDIDHDDLRDVHNQMHIRGTYSEATDRMALIKAVASKSKMNKPVKLTKKPDTIKKMIGRHKYFSHIDDVTGYDVKSKGKGMNRFEEVELEEGVATAQKVMDRANVVAKTNPDPKKRFAASGLAQKAMMRTINPTGVNTGITRGGGNKTYRMVTGKVPPYQLTKKTGVSEEVELDEVTKQEAEKMLGGPVKTRTGSEPKGKLPLGFRRARNLARKAMKTVKESTTEVSEVNEMNHGKKLAKMIMAKQSQHPIAQNMGEENIVEQDDSMEKKEMAQTQLHFIKYAAEEILAFIDMGGEVEEWYQNKLSKVQSEVESLHSYIEGEKRRTGMVKEEEEQIDEKAPPGAKFERMVKHIKKGYAKDGLTKQEKGIAYATAWKAYNKKNEEVEQIDEKVEIFHKQGSGADMERYKKDASNPAAVLARKKAADAARQSRAAGDLKSKNMGQTASTGNGGAVKAVSTMSQGFKKGSRITEAEGTVAVTPKEKALAAHHGDPKKITYGDVIKARLKSAAAKKMGKQ